MILLQFLKPLSVLSLHFTLFGTLLSFATVVQGSILPALLFALVWMLCYLRREKEKPLLPLALLLILPLFVTGWADVGLYGFAVYHVYTECKNQRFGISQMAFASGFYSQILFIPPLLIGGWLFGFGTVIESYTLPFVVLYFSSSILLLRVLRADDATLQDKAFLRANLRTLLFTLGSAFLLSTETAMTIFRKGLNLFYLQIIMPILNYALSIFLYILTKLAWLGKFFFTREVVYTDDGAGEVMVGIEMEYEEVVLIETPEWVKLLFFALLLVALAYIAVRIFKRMQGEKLKETSSYSTTTISTAAPVGKKGFSFPKLKNNNEKLRETYLGFMEHCMEQGITIPVWMDSRQLLQNYGEHPKAVALRELYIKARYGDHVVSKEEAKMAKGYLATMKKERGKE